MVIAGLADGRLLVFVPKGGADSKVPEVITSVSTLNRAYSMGKTMMSENTALMDNIEYPTNSQQSFH